MSEMNIVTEQVLVTILLPQGSAGPEATILLGLLIAALSLKTKITMTVEIKGKRRKR